MFLFFFLEIVDAFRSSGYRPVATPLCATPRAQAKGGHVRQIVSALWFSHYFLTWRPTTAIGQVAGK